VSPWFAAIRRVLKFSGQHTNRNKAIINSNTMDNHPDTEVFNIFDDSEVLREEMEVDEVLNQLVLELLSSSERRMKKTGNGEDPNQVTL
jgi:hypothetical protein